MPDENPYEGEEPTSSENSIQTIKEEGLEGPTMVSTEAPDVEEEEDVPDVSRKQKKRNRFKEAHDRADASDARAEASDTRSRDLERRLGEMEGRESRRVRDNPGPDPMKERLENIDERIRSNADLYNAKVDAGNVTNDDFKSYIGKAKVLDDEKFDARFDMKRREEAPSQTKIDPVQLAREMRYPEVHKDPLMRSAAYTKGQLWYRDNPGKEIPESVTDEIANSVMKEFGKGGYSRGHAPTPDQRRNHAGPPRGRSAAQRAAPEKRIEMTRERKQMAESLYSDVEPEEAHAKWAQGPGKRMMQRAWEAGGR